MTASGLLVLFLMTGLGLVGFVDDFIKLFMRRSLGLRSGAKLLGQAVVGVIFAVLALHFPDGYDLTPASEHLSFTRRLRHLPRPGPVRGLGAGDGDRHVQRGEPDRRPRRPGLRRVDPGAGRLRDHRELAVRNDCTTALAPNCYHVRDPLDAAVVAAAVMGACFGFLWWNAPPAKIFMGDTGSLALGGALAGLAIVTRTELLLLLLGGLFVIITMSVVIQVSVFKVTKFRTGKPYRVFRMAPLQHHFELAGWAETTIVVRFWLIAGMFVAAGLGIFYVGWFPKLSG